MSQSSKARFVWRHERKLEVEKAMDGRNAMFTAPAPVRLSTTANVESTYNGDEVSWSLTPNSQVNKSSILAVVALKAAGSQERSFCMSFMMCKGPLLQQLNDEVSVLQSPGLCVTKNEESSALSCTVSDSSVRLLYFSKVSVATHSPFHQVKRPPKSTFTTKMLWTRATSIAAACLATFSSSAQAAAPAFGYTTSSSRYVINTGSGLTVSMLPSTCDIVSLKYKDQELQYTSKYTHVNSGLGSVTSSITTLSDAKKTIQVTCSKTGITQYYFFRPSENVIYMGTYHSNNLVLPELRFLARLDRTTVTTGVEEATLDDTVGAIEAHDVYATSGNITRSKFYSGRPFKDDKIHGVRGPTAGVYFVISELGYETSSSGPFFRDINNQCTTANELTFYMNSDHTRTDDYRYGFHGPYALAITDGPAPESTDVVNFDFFQEISMTGFVPADQRGEVQGSIDDPNSILGNNVSVVVGFSNADAQYWVELGAGERNFTSPLMKPGSYKMVVYKKQLVVATQAAVSVSVGDVTTQDIQVTFTENADAIWTIGVWDGTPDGFLNADKIHSMHPSDTRMTPWEPVTFSAGTDNNELFPMAQFRGVNDPIAVTFSLTDDQITTPRKLKIGVTLAQSGARPSVRVNDKWSGPVLTSGAIKTRGVTRGVTTGNYMLYEYTIPVSALVAGENKIVLGIASGNTDPEQPFLHAAVVFDALELS